MSRSFMPNRRVIVGGIVLALAVGVTLAFRPLSAFWLQQQGGAVVVDLSADLPDESGGFACLAEPLEDAEAQARLGKAIDQLEQASRLLPGQAHLYYPLGRAYCMAGRYDLAAQTLPKFTALRPKNPQADLELGFALEKLCPPAGECEGLTSASVWQRAGVLPEHLIANGEAARKKEDFSRAIDWYRRAEAMGADLRSTIAFVRYQAALKEGRDQEAYAALEEAVRTDTGWANADLRFLGWYRYGQLLSLNNSYKEAEEALIKAILLSEDNQMINNNYLSEAYRFLGLVIANQKRVEESLVYFKRSVELNNKNIWALIHYGKYLFFHDSRDRFISQNLFEKALLLSESNVSIWNNIINFWIEQEQIEMVMEVCQLAKNLSINTEELTYCSKS